MSLHPAPGTTETVDGPAGIKLHINWGPDGGEHAIVIDFPPEMPEEDCIFYQDCLTTCLLEEGINPFADSMKDGK